MTRFSSHALTLALLTLALIAPLTRGQAQDPPNTEKALDRLARALQQDQALAPATRQALQDLVAAMKAERNPGQGPLAAADARVGLSGRGGTAQANEPSSALLSMQDKPKWEQVFDKLNIYGDVRLRHESSFNQDGKDDRHRERMRLRFRLDYQINDELTLGGGIRTGDPDDPNSPYVTLGDGFDDFDVSIDRALVNYRPQWAEGAWVTAGKFINPIKRNPVYGELVWDADVNPEGIVGGYTVADVGPFDQLDFMIGGYTVLEDGSTDDVFALAAQVAGRLSFDNDLSAMLAVGYYVYSDATPEGNLALLLGDNAGNAVVDRDGDGTADDFVSDFAILNPIAAVTYEGWAMPLTVSGEYILNTRAHGSGDQGWAFGASYGKTKGKGDWRLYYQWQVIERESVFSAFAQDDFLLATNFRGHVFGANYQFADNIGLHLWGLVSARDMTFAGLTTDSDKDQWRLRADLTIKF